MIQFELDYALDFHQHWLRDRRFGRRADFTGRTLKNLNIKYKDLTGAILNGTNLHYCNLSNSNLEDIVANGSHFDNVDFTDTNLRNAHFQKALFTSCTLENTDLWDVTGNGTQIISLQLGGNNVCYTSEILQINCKQFKIDILRTLTDDEIRRRMQGKPDEETEEAIVWWDVWGDQIQQIINENPAISVN